MAFGATYFTENTYLVYCISLAIVLPVLFFDELRDFSYIACLFFITVVASVVGMLIGLFELRNNTSSNHVDFKNVNWIYLPEYIGMISFCLGGVTMIIPIRSTMQNPHQFRTIFKSSFIINSIIFYNLGLFATFSYGNFLKINENRFKSR